MWPVSEDALYTPRTETSIACNSSIPRVWELK